MRCLIQGITFPACVLVLISNSSFSCHNAFSGRRSSNKYYYRLQRSCGQGYVFTHVCDFVHAGIPPGKHTPPGSTPLRKHTPWKHTHTSPGSTPPQEAHTHIPGKHTPPGSRLHHTVHERPVRILLECILVNIMLLFGLIFRRSTRPHIDIEQAMSIFWSTVILPAIDFMVQNMTIKSKLSKLNNFPVILAEFWHICKK